MSVAPQNLLAEDHVLGAMLLSASAIDAVRDVVAAHDFFKLSNGIVFRRILAMRDGGTAVDAITVAAELERHGELADAGGDMRMHELAAIVPSTANAAHYARLVRETATRRRLVAVGNAVLGAAENGGLSAHPEVREQLVALLEDEHRATESDPLAGFDHAAVLDLTFERERELIEGLVPTGAVGTIAGVPESFKSWTAQNIAATVAAGDGDVFGHRVATTGAVGYFWQDDSDREEAERVKAFSRVHQFPRDLPITWFLNLGVVLPRDLGRVRATVEAHGFVLIVLDSFYNFALGIDLKDDAAERIVAALKHEITDPTGCTVLLVDHMPWPTESNRARLRAYGGVFKSAATRFGIYIDAQGSKLWVEARGNNIRGFKRTPAYWNADRLELHLADAEDPVDHGELVEGRAKKVLEHLRANPAPHSTTAVRQAVKGRESVTDQALELLKTQAEVQDIGRNGGPWSGRRGDPRYWIASNHAVSDSLGTSAHTTGPTPADHSADPVEDDLGPAPIKGPRSDRADLPDNLQTTLDALAARAEGTSP